MGDVADSGLSDITIEPDLVVLGMSAASDQEAIDVLAHRLRDKDYVKEEYVQAIKEREKVFCTGLALDEACIAVPHTDPIHVNKQAVAIGVLKNPVSFGEMGTASDKVNVQLVFMLGIRKLDSQVDFLGGMIDALQGKGRLKSIRDAASPEEVVRLFKRYLEE